MSIKTTLASAGIIQGLVATSTGVQNITPTFAGRAEVIAGTNSTASGLRPSRQMQRPGVFTTGTVPEGTASYPNNDSIA